MEVQVSMQEARKSAFALYTELQCRLMRRFIASGGSAAEWCERLAPAFHRRWSWILDTDQGAVIAAPRRTLVFRLGPTESPCREQEMLQEA